LHPARARCGIFAALGRREAAASPASYGPATGAWRTPTLRPWSPDQRRGPIWSQYVPEGFVANQLEVVFLTVFSGTVTYVLGQLALKLVVEPVHDLKKTIGGISHSLIERESDIFNPGLGQNDVMDETARELRKLASQLQSHLYLIPWYTVMARIFRLPFPAKILVASKALKGLANGIRKSTDGVNAKYVKTVCDSLRIYNEP
jgi:hypothetical protein